MLSSISSVPSLKGKRVLVRTSFNVPIAGGIVQDDTRIKGALPTITLLREKGARVVLISHVSEGESGSLRPVFEYIKKDMPVQFIEEIFSSAAQTILNGMQDGDLVLCENIRIYPEEEKNNDEFAQQIAALFDFYVNDDFTVAHREHATIVSLPKYLKSYMGLQFEKEVKYLSLACDPERPAFCIMGGAKPETKIPLAAHLAGKFDYIFMGGISANILLKAKGYEVGKSVTSDSVISTEKILSGQNVLLPVDVQVRTETGECLIKNTSEVEEGDIILDAGPETIECIRTYIQSSAFVLWNGPLGDYEKGFFDATIAVGNFIAAPGVRSIIGGGDTIAALGKHGLLDQFTFVSTAGGAMIQYLTDGTLPGIEALKEKE